MNHLQEIIPRYLEFCRTQKRLDEKTLKAYRIDLRQFADHLNTDRSLEVSEISREMLECYIAIMHREYKPKTVKRKLASLKALFHYLEYEELIVTNPFNRMRVKFREPVILPKTIPLFAVESFLTTMYKDYEAAATRSQKEVILRDIAIIELLFATGMRISELCALTPGAVDMHDRTILIYGKGSKERRIQIGSDAVAKVLENYAAIYWEKMQRYGSFFVNQEGHPVSDQSIRRMINRYAKKAGIGLHITPHMFRHTFATSLLEEDVDIRYIQEMLGHSSIHITEIYTHVTLSKQRDILITKHPRSRFHV